MPKLTIARRRTNQMGSRASWFRTSSARLDCDSDIARAAATDVDGPARVGRHHNRVVDDDVVLRPLGAVRLEKDDAAGMVAVKQVVGNGRILHAV